MKLGPENIGQKFTGEVTKWDSNSFFKLLAISSKGTLLGEYENGYATTFPWHYEWLPYEEPKKEVKKVVMSPAIVMRELGYPRFSYLIFKNEKGAKDCCGDEFISWPATQLIDGKEVPVQYLVTEEE